eukprot:1509537-Rhodomonas_salina.1
MPGTIFPVVSDDLAPRSHNLPTSPRLTHMSPVAGAPEAAIERVCREDSLSRRHRRAVPRRQSAGVRDRARVLHDPQELTPPGLRCPRCPAASLFVECLVRSRCCGYPCYLGYAMRGAICAKSSAFNAQCFLCCAVRVADKADGNTSTGDAGHGKEARQASQACGKVD